MKANGSLRSALIFGGAGFIGSNWAHHLLTRTEARVHVFDNLSRSGVRHNLEWLQAVAARTGRFQITIGDVRDSTTVEQAVRQATEIYHFAAQVAVTSSISDPRHDFEVNVVGTFNILEAARKSGNQPFLLFTSTNKVYGDIAEYQLKKNQTRYEFLTIKGINESQRLDFHSPYGCSKGAADQYVRDYARIYGIPAVVFRMSCIAGERQFGNEDQGWVAHFLYSAMDESPLTIYGDGRQVRDVLYVKDLLNAFEAARRNSTITGSQIYNVGGGIKNSTSLLELIAYIELLIKRKVRFSYGHARAGDQLVYVTDCSKLEHDTGWRALNSVQQILRRIYEFRMQNQSCFARSIESTAVPDPLVISPVPLQRTA